MWHFRRDTKCLRLLQSSFLCNLVLADMGELPGIHGASTRTISTYDIVLTFPRVIGHTFNRNSRLNVNTVLYEFNFERPLLFSPLSHRNQGNILSSKGAGFWSYRSVFGIRFCVDLTCGLSRS